MKKLLAIICFLSFSFGSYARLSWSPGESMKTAMVNTIAKAYYMEQNSSSLGFSGGNNFFGAYLNIGGSVSMTFHLQESTEYVFIGGGGNSATDVDITVTTPSGYTYKDVQTDKTPIVRFTAYSTGTYTLNLKLYNGSSGSFCCMALLKSGGYTISASRFDNAIDNMTDYCDRVDNGTDYNLKFLDVSNQWCMYGGLIGQGDEMSVNTISMGYGNRTVIASGDNVSTDIDLYINRNGYEVVKDTDPDASPLTSFYGNGDGYEVKVKNASSSGRSFIMYCILKKY